MKTYELIKKLIENDVKMDSFQVVAIDCPLSDCARLFGDFNSCILPSTGIYLAEWVDADKQSQIGSPDALLVLDDVMNRGLVHLYHID